MSLFLLLIFTQKGDAATYYVSNSGSDTNNGTSSATPWKTITKVNSSMSSFQAGDNILFKSGDIFYGTLTISKSGSAASSIVFSNYGSGNLPILRASEAVTGWTNLGGNIWRATLANISGSRVPNIYLDGIKQPLGRYPDFNTTDGGYRYISSFSGTTSFTDNSLSGTPNFTGSEVIVKSQNHHYACIASAHSGSTVSITAPNTTGGPAFAILKNFGYFFQNNINTLSFEGEWYHDATNNLVYLYTTTDPNSRNVEAPKFTNTVVITNVNYITLNALQIESAVTANINGSNSKFITIQNCVINNAHTYGMYTYKFIDAQFLNNTVTNSDDMGVRFERDGANPVDTRNTFRGNTIQYICDRIGGGTSQYAGMIGLRVIGEKDLIEDNFISDIGYSGITHSSGMATIRHNEIQKFCMHRDDGGGIYVAGDNGHPNTYIQVYENFIHDAYGAYWGVASGSGYKAVGIYLDNGTEYWECYKNVIYNIEWYGILANLSSKNWLHDNTVFNCKSAAVSLNTYGNTLGSGGTALTALYNNVKDNIFFSRASTQRCADYTNSYNPSDLTTNLGSLDNNYYCQPYTGGSEIQVKGSSTNSLTVAQFKAQYPAYEANGKAAPIKIASNSDPNTFIRFETNMSASATTVNLGTTNYTDAKGMNYTGNVSIPAYSALALIKGTTPTVALDLVSFTAQLKDSRTGFLNWRTINEVNHAYFDVERSEDGVHFSKIGQVFSDKNASKTHDYAFEDNTIKDLKIVYYRLKIVDNAGESTFSKTVALTMDKNAKASLTVFPNPFDNSLSTSLHSPFADNAHCRILSLDGKVMIEKNRTLQKGDNVLVLDDLNVLISGSYILEIKTMGDFFVKKVVKK